MKRRILAGISALSLAGALIALPANAASTYIQVCNSSDGDAGDIVVWKTNTSYYKTLPNNGSCTGDLYNADNSVRVDTRGGESYKIKPIGIGYSGTYGPWHCNGGIIDSDPPNASKVYYKMSKYNEC